MKRLILALAVATFVFGSCTSTCDPFGGTRETKMKKYSGDPQAKEPYQKQEAPKVGRVAKQGCTSAGCTYTVMERVMIHNPMDQKINADVTCSWSLTRASEGDYTAAKNSRKGITVDAKSSRGVEIQQMLTLSQELVLSVTAKCSMVWKPIK